jgi:predicted phage replisome organizer
MADVKWIKVSTDMFDGSRKIKQIEMMPEGDTILVIWLKLLLLAGNVNDGGAIYLTPEIPYTEEMLANELRRPLNTVRMALTIFEKFGMIEIVDDILHLSAWEKYQSVDKLADIRERNRLAQQRSRERRRQLQAANDMSCDSHVTGHECHALEEEGEEDKEKESHSIIHSAREESKMRFLGGSLGKGVVMLSEEQIDSLLEELSVDEFDKYVGIIAEMELSGKHYKKKTHYQAILDMAAKDRRVNARKEAEA